MEKVIDRCKYCEVVFKKANNVQIKLYGDLLHIKCPGCGYHYPAICTSGRVNVLEPTPLEDNKN